MEKKYIKNERNNWVRENANNLHKENCICWDCQYFKPTQENKGCSIILKVLTIANENDIILPVWECKKFELSK